MFAESGVANERVTTSSGHNIYRISVAGYKDFVAMLQVVSSKYNSSEYY